MNDSGFIACGMYTLSRQLEQAWQTLFAALEVDGERLHARVVFAADEALLRDPRLIFGHTCGYPLMTRLQDALTPFCVPVFDVPGTDGKRYRSYFVVPAGSAIDSLQQCRGTTVAINGADSNSGMNVLRHALARCGARPGFFSAVLVSGGHLHSLRAVAENRAQLAAIDCVSLQLIGDLHPELRAGVRIIGDSDRTCGLPLVMPLAPGAPGLGDQWRSALNRALSTLPPAMRRALHLEHFAAASIDDFAGILELQDFAVAAGYPELN
jgi:ABC-type phosphate/phosphonate transport system substrate-binding protein